MMEVDDNDLWNQSILCSLELVSKEKKLLFVSMYCLIWGEASNIRFLPECLCYIFHHVNELFIECLEWIVSFCLLLACSGRFLLA